MLGQLNHVAIAVPDIKAAADTYRKKFNAKVSDAVPQPDHGVTTVFVDLGNTKIELLEPLGEDSPIMASWPRTRRAASITSASRWTISRPPASG